MSKKIPLEIRKNYSIKDQGNHWELVCDACSHKFALDKPAKGAAIEVGKLRVLSDHATTHPIPGDEVEEKVEVKPPPKVSLVKTKTEPPKVSKPAPPVPEKAPVSHLVPKFASHAYPSPINPNPYKVEMNGTGMKVSSFRDPSHVNYCQVERTEGGYKVTLFAANPKHASLVGERIISRHMSAQRKEA